MPDILTILIALMGIFFVGLALSAINLVTNATRFIAVGLLVAFVILMTSRTFSVSPSSEVPSRPGINIPRSNLTGRDLLSGFRSNVGNFSDSLDAFVYGPQAKIGWQTLPEKVAAAPKNLPSDRPISNRPADRPASRPADRAPTQPRPATQRPISAWW
jgi:hypothetical protein